MSPAFGGANTNYKERVRSRFGGGSHMILSHETGHKFLPSRLVVSGVASLASVPPSHRRRHGRDDAIR
ncbi:hypothetical protein HYQ46_012505 [Verticillium longisporum]|nr:hypothetical protein HYQ46_012505 [Verticillium longisporum]